MESSGYTNRRHVVPLRPEMRFMYHAYQSYHPDPGEADGLLADRKYI